MIKSTFYSDEAGEVVEFKLYGHAGFAQSGFDIVCAAVSILVINTVNSIETLVGANFSFQENEDEGFMHFTLVDKDNKQAKLLLESLRLGITSIEKEFSNYLKVTFKEV